MTFVLAKEHCRHTALSTPWGRGKQASPHGSCAVYFSFPLQEGSRGPACILGLLGHPSGRLPSEITSLGSLMVCSTDRALFGAFYLFIVSTTVSQVYIKPLQVKLWAERKTPSRADFPLGQGGGVLVTPSFLHSRPCRNYQASVLSCTTRCTSNDS